MLESTGIMRNHNSASWRDDKKAEMERFLYQLADIAPLLVANFWGYSRTISDHGLSLTFLTIRQ